MSSESRVSMWHLIDERPLPSEADDNIPESEDLNFLPEDSAADESEWYRGIRDEDHSIAPSEFSPGLGVDREDDGDCLRIGRESENPLHEVSDFSFSRLAAHSSFKRLRLERPRQAWESHPAFNRKSGSSSLHAWASAAFLPSVGVRETLNFPKPEESYGGEEAAHVPWTIERRLKGVRIQRSDEDERNHALKKLKAVVLLDPLATALGKSLVQKTGALETEEIIAASFSDAFSSKSAGTLTKRAGSLQRLVVQLYKQGVASPWRMEEADLYSALTTLREEGCGATSPAHMLESLHFLHAIARFLHMDLELVISARCKGVAHSCFMSKAPLEQRDPLTCFQVRRLEEAMVRAGPVGQCILGQILFCVHAVCRWKDSQKLKLLELLGTGESQILFGDALGSKTSLSKEAKTKFTPYAALAQGLTECSWARLWIEARRQCRLTFGAGPDGFCLPTRFQRLDEWGSTPMGAGEASSYLAEILEGSESEGQVLGTHSLKVTLLTWASRSTVVRLSKGERLLLGHHIVPGVKSMVTYSREAYTSLIGKLLALYRSIRSGAFQPDLAPADRVLQVADALAAAEEGQGLGAGARDEAAAEQLAGFEGESEDSADDAEADGPFELPGQPAVRALRIVFGIQASFTVVVCALRDTPDILELGLKIPMYAAMYESHERMLFPWRLGAVPERGDSEEYAYLSCRCYCPWRLGAVPERGDSEEYAYLLLPWRLGAVQYAYLSCRCYCPWHLEAVPERGELGDYLVQGGDLCQFFVREIAESGRVMASANLDSEAAFLDRARKIGLSEETLTGLLNNSFNTFGRLAFAVSATPTTLTDEAVDNWIDGLGMRPSGFQKASLRRLLFEGVSMAIEEVRTRIEPGVEGHPKKLAAAERLDRQARQERSLGGLVFTPETRPANSCVDLCVEMLETGVLQYHVPSKWISRAQEAQCLKRDSSINIDADNNLKIATKSADQTCDVSSEMRLRQAWSRRSLAFDLANLASFRVMEEHVQFLFSVLQRAQPKGFQGVTLSQIIEADKQMFILASNNLMGRLTASPGAAPALDAEISRLSRSPDIMQYLAPLQNPVIPHECAEFPYASRVMTRFVQERLPGHVFSTCGIFADSLTPLHRDGRNAQWPNAVFRLSDFKEGGLWIEGPGDDVRVFNSKELVGAVHEIEDEPLLFDAWSKYHETEPWSGRRVVLITWVVQQLEKLEQKDVEAAHQLNFVLPPEVPLPVQTAQLGERPPMVFEVFAGKGLLSRALMQCGFVVHSFDQHHCDSHVPISQLDLATDSGQALFWEFLETQRPFAIHLGAPCGTSSKARGRPLYNGQPGPQPLRSSEFPLGLPSLKPGSVEATRVKLANRLYAFTYRILRYCLERDIVVSLENPANSFLWEVLQAFEPQGVAHRILPRLQSIIFDLCCHGGFRPKRTKLLATPGCFEPLRALCDGKHMHKPWGQIVEFGSIRYATKDEAAYPALFASRFASCVERKALSLGLNLCRRPSPKDLSLAMLGRQNKRHQPLVSEYQSVITMPAVAFKSQKHFKLLRSIGGEELRASTDPNPNTPLGGTIPEASKPTSNTPLRGTISEANTPISSRDPAEKVGDRVRVGVYRTPEQFVEEAKKVIHPVDSSNPLEKATLFALKENLTKDPRLIVLKRNLAVARVKQEVKRCSDAEAELHKAMHPAVAKVMSGKSILALESLLKSEGYDDLEVIGFLKEGVRLVGTSQCPECFDRKFVPAFLTETELMASAATRRKSLLSKFERVDPEEARILKEATDEEVAMGFLEGPYYDQSQITELLGTNDWTVIRRFVLLQGAELKPRPIDNCLESQLNAGYSSSIHLRLQDSDYISAMALHVAREVSEGRAHKDASEWKGKTLDLSKAYKQLAIHPSHRPLSVIAVRQSDGKDALYVSDSLMFGSTAAVYAFNRVSRALWFLLNKLLCIPAAVFFDDYPLMSPAGSADNADTAASAFLDALGWRHAKTGAKGRPFASDFDVLGMHLGLGDLAKGTVVLANKQGRIERIVDRLQEISLKGEIRRHEAQVIQGLLQYASGFYAGRSLKHASHILARIVGGLHFSPRDLSDFCKHTVSLLKHENPRVLSCAMITDIIHLWTDGSWEADVGGIGLAAHDCFSGTGWVFTGKVPSQLLESWKAEVGEQLICEIEMFAVLASLLQLNALVSSRRIVWWVDNDATRGVMIKGASRSWAMHTLARVFSELDREWPSMWWVCRVPSYSNPGDAPSRDQGEESLVTVGASCVQPFSRLEELVGRIQAFNRA
ncbi:unnamed protein product [Symbiodinium sp. CCMP2592]|nr:unnamed protein product [Symbiodinium sp. CCMP2592]